MSHEPKLQISKFSPKLEIVFSRKLVSVRWRKLAAPPTLTLHERRPQVDGHKTGEEEEEKKKKNWLSLNKIMAKTQVSCSSSPLFELFPRTGIVSPPSIVFLSVQICPPLSLSLSRFRPLEGRQFFSPPPRLRPSTGFHRRRTRERPKPISDENQKVRRAPVSLALLLNERHFCLFFAPHSWPLT